MSSPPTTSPPHRLISLTHKETLNPFSPKLSLSAISLRSREPTYRTHKSTKAVALSSTLEMAGVDSGEESTVPVIPKKVLVPIGFGTEEMEAVILVDVLRRAGAEVTVASVEPQLEVESSGGTRLVAGTNISTCADEIYDLVALPVNSFSSSIHVLCVVALKLFFLFICESLW